MVALFLGAPPAAAQETWAEEAAYVCLASAELAPADTRSVEMLLDAALAAEEANDLAKAVASVDEAVRLARSKIAEDVHPEQSWLPLLRDI